MSSDSIYRFYVYAYLRSSDSNTAKAGTPYYIGKGTGKRAWVKHKFVHVPSDKSKIVILENNLSNIGACALERRYIRWFGKKTDGSGILINSLDGGDGAIGPKSKETRLKMSKAQIGKKHTKESKLKIAASAKTQKHSEETKTKISASKIGIKKSEETKEKMSNSKKNIPRSEETRAKISATLKKKRSSIPLDNSVPP